MNRLDQGLWLGAAVAVALFSACGDSGGTDGGNTCTTDSSCGTGKLCHPLLKQCVAACTGSADCPSSAKTCRTFAGADPSTDGGTALAFCQCSTDQLCNGGSSGSLVCMAATKTCEDKCTASSCPSGYNCNSTTGQCASGNNNDAGTDGGTDAGTCDWGTCTTAEICNFTTNHCEIRACNTSNDEPDTCGYAGWCASDSSCTQVEPPTCANFTPPGGKTPLFNPSTSTGPIIYYVDDEAIDDVGFCHTTENAFTLTVRAYRTDADWPMQLTAVPGFKYVRTDGQEIDATTLMRPSSGYVHQAKTATLKLTLCSSATSNLSAGFYFTNGNETCAVATGGTPGTVP